MTLTADHPAARKRPNRLHAELLTAGSWSARHGVARVAMNRARKRGDLQAKLFSDLSLRPWRSTGMDMDSDRLGRSTRLSSRL